MLEKLAIYREICRKSQRQIAQEAGVSQAFVSNIENGFFPLESSEKRKTIEKYIIEILEPIAKPKLRMFVDSK